VARAVEDTDKQQPAQTDPDWEVLRRVAAGDVESFGAFVGRQQRSVHQLCFRMLGDAEAAADATQDILLKVFRQAGSFEPRGKVSTWLYRIAVNHCLNKLRRRRLVRFLSFGELGGSDAESGEEQELDPADDGPDAEERLRTRERWQATRQALDALPENQRTVVLLSKFEGLSQREIADVLGISEGAVESRLVRAMRTLTAARDAQEMPKDGVSRV
jgi:RNA polymerase sigma-70 factor (ECF subfamily)